MTKRPPFDRMQADVIARVVAGLREELKAEISASADILRMERALSVKQRAMPKPVHRVRAGTGRSW